MTSKYLWGRYRNLAVAPDGTLWVTARGGIRYFDGTGWTAYTEADRLVDDLVYAVDAAPRRLGKGGHPGWRRSFRWATWIGYTVADGLAGDLVWYVAVGPDVSTWLATSRGVVHLQP